MTRDEGVARIKEQLGFRTTLDSSIVNQLILAQVLLEANHPLPWFLVSEDSYTVTDIGDERVSIPLDFLAETDEAVFKYVPDVVSGDNPEVDLVKDDYDTLRINYRDDSTGLTKVGPPEAYALLGNYFRIFPTPDALYTLKTIYYAKDTTLDTNVENKWLKYAPMLILGRAGKFIAGPLRDTAAMQIFGEWEQIGQTSLIRRDTDRDLANRSLQMGGPH
jgi:hypothetical protein